MLDGSEHSPSALVTQSRDGERIVAELQKNRREVIRITRCRSNGHELVNVRIWAPGHSGEMIPTKAGLAFRIDLLPEVLVALQKAREPSP
jgi:hypothetical protein